MSKLKVHSIRLDEKTAEVLHYLADKEQTSNSAIIRKSIILFEKGAREEPSPNELLKKINGLEKNQYDLITRINMLIKQVDYLRKAEELKWARQKKLL